MSRDVFVLSEIFVLLETDYDESYVVGVFSSVEVAKRVTDQ